jgi:hypothetical protein
MAKVASARPVRFLPQGSKAEVTRFVNLTGSSTLPGTPFVTPANVGDFTAEY